MTVGVNGWRIHDQRTGVGRYLHDIVTNWTADLVDPRFTGIHFYSQAPVRKAGVTLPRNVQERVLPSGAPMLVWENTRFGPAAKHDVLFCPSYSRPLIARGRVVVTVFEATLKLYPEYFPRQSRYSSPHLYLRLYEWSAHHSQLVLTCTATAKEDIIRAYRVPADRIRVVYLAPADVFRCLGDDPGLPEFRTRLFGEDVPCFLFVGKLTPRRNIPKLLEAFARFKKSRRSPHKLVIVGKNTTGLAIQEYAEQLGIARDVIHFEYIPDSELLLLYNAADAFILPLAYEAVSLTALEAQATGLPVITMDTPGLREMTGGIGVFLEKPEVDHIAEAMSMIAFDHALRSDLRTRGLAFAGQFSWRRTAAETLAVLQEAACA